MFCHLPSIFQDIFKLIKLQEVQPRMTWIFLDIFVYKHSLFVIISKAILSQLDLY